MSKDFWNAIPTIIARDRHQPPRILLGGLGSLGIGSMWFDDDGTRYAGLPGYESAPERESPAKLVLVDLPTPTKEG